MLGLTPYVPTVGHALAWGVTASGVAQLGVAGLVAVRRAGMPLHIPRPRLTPQMRLLFRRMAPGLIGAGATQLNLAVDVVIASLLPAGDGLGAVLCRPGAATAPWRDRHRGRHRHAAAAVPPGPHGRGGAAITTLNRAIEYALFLTLPAALALAVCGVPGHVGAVRPRRVRRRKRAACPRSASPPMRWACRRWC